MTKQRASLVPCALLLVLTCGTARGADLLAINRDTGAIYDVSPTTAGLTFLANSGVPAPSALELGPDGFYYSFSTNGSGTLYRIHPTTYVGTAVGPMGVTFPFEGAIAFAPDGTAYATNANGADMAQLLRLNLSTGAATVVGQISGVPHDINGLAWRNDGLLVGLDREGNRLLTINPTTAASALIANVTPTIGGLGGMAVLNGVGYFSTSGPGGSTPGSNELWQVNLFTGAHTRIGSFAPTITGSANGIAGLAAVPEPVGGAIVLFAMVALSARRKQR